MLTNGRGGTDIGRTGGGGGRVRELLFGFSPVSGTWALDSRGKIVGFLNELLVVTSVTTNYFASTNTFTLVNSQLTSETTNVTVSFTNGQPDASVVINWPDPSPGFTQDFVLGNTNFTTSVGSVQTLDTVSFTGSSSRYSACGVPKRTKRLPVTSGLSAAAQRIVWLQKR